MVRTVIIPGTKEGSELEDAFAWYLKVSGVATPERQYHFKAPGHRQPYRLDFAWPDRLIAIEVDGGSYSGGRHTRGSGFETDCVRGFEAAIAGWRIGHVTGKMIDDGRAVALTERLLATHRPRHATPSS